MRTVTVLTGCVVAGLLTTSLVGVASARTTGPATPSATTRATTLPALSHVAVSFSKRSSAFSQPVQVTSAADSSSRLFVVQLGGLVRVFNGGKVQSPPYLDLRSRISQDGGERGLLGVAFRKDFAKKPYVWVTYVAKNGSLQLSRFTAKSARSLTVNAGTEKKILNVPHPNYSNHNGGSLAFANSGLLFIGTGDGGSGGDPSNNAQNGRRLLGKILRIDVYRSCGSKAYCVPTNNPFAKSKKVRPEIWATGVRNPWKTSVDPRTGDLWIGDVGQNAYEEIDKIPAGKGGWNLGWSCREASHVYNASRCGRAKLHGPVASYSHKYGAAVIGGSVYRGKAYAKLLAGRYLFGDFGSGRIWAGSGASTRQVGSLKSVTSFGVDSAGEIWAVTLDGGLYAMKARRV